MKEKRRFLSLLIVVFSFICLSINVYAVNSGNKEDSGNKLVDGEEYSKRFLDWYNLPEDIKKDAIAPLPVNIEYQEKSSNEDFPNLEAQSIPTSFDLRSKINIEVKDQMSTGECWAFSANSTVETYLALRNETYNFSERHMEYSTQPDFREGKMFTDFVQARETVGVGGMSSSAFQYFAKASGPILEEDMPFENNENLIRYEDLPKNNTVKKVDDMIYFPTIYKKYSGSSVSYVDANGNYLSSTNVNNIRNTIKAHILENGAVTTDIYAPNMEGGRYFNSTTYAAYNPATDRNSANSYSNHSVTIIGWDDNFSKSNFKAVDGRIPSSNGAWIILNSWGTEWGDGGIYYISYEDYLVESQIRGIVKVSNVDFDNSYIYDTHEVLLSYTVKYAANVFTAKKNETLTKITLGSNYSSTVNVYVNPNGSSLSSSNLTLIASGITLNPGFNTIELDRVINLSSGTKFAIVVELVSGTYNVGLETNIDGYITSVTSKPGQSYYSMNGSTWNDIFDSNDMMNFSIKAYTKVNTNSIKFSEFKLPNKVLFKSNGGVIKAKLKTSTSYEGKEIGIAIFDSNDNDVTSNFTINKNKIESTISNLKITVPKGMNAGTYKVKVSIDGNSVLEKSFVISDDNFDTTKYVKIKCVDENLYRALKVHVLESKQIYAYFDDTKELILNKDIESLDFVEKKVDGNDTYFTGNAFSISYLDGLEGLTNLRYLNVSYNPIRSLKPLQKLTNLTEFELYRIDVNDYYGIGLAPITDVNALSGLTKLEKLTITHSSISDLSFISNLTNLTSLQLQVNSIKDISYLKGLTKLKSVSLDDNMIKDISVFEYLTGLSVISLDSNYIRNPEVLDSIKKSGSDFYIPFQSVDYVTNLRTNVGISSSLKKVFDKTSILYSSQGATLDGCYWSTTNSTFNFSTGSNTCNITVSNGNHYRSVYTYTYVDTAKVTSIEVVTAPTKISGSGLSLSKVGGVVKINYSDGTSEIRDMDDEAFTLSGYNPKVNGEQTITVSFGNFSATFKVNVVYVPVSVSVKTAPTKIKYNQDTDLDLTGGKLTVKMTDGTTKEVSMTDSKVSISGYDRWGFGPITIRVTYTENGESVFTTFKVTILKDLSGFTVNTIANQTFTGSKLTPAVTVMDDTYKLVSGKDYTVSYTNNQYPGTATVTIKGAGNYGGTLTRTFKIVVSPISGLTQSAQSTNYVTIKWTKNTKLTGYEVYYSTSKNGTYKKVSTITKNSTVTYKKTGLSAGKNYYFKVRGYKTYNNKKYYTSYVLIETATKPSKVTISNPTTKNGALLVKWKKLSASSGYEVYYSTSKSSGYKKVYTSSSNKIVAYSIPNLVKGKTYYVKVRAYKMANGKKIYGDFSAVKSIKVK